MALLVFLLLEQQQPLVFTYAAAAGKLKPKALWVWLC
jgi:hypothetical protein